MNRKTVIMALVLATALSVFATAQWSPQDFVDMAQGDGSVIVDANVAGSSTIVILSNNLTASADAPFDDMYLNRWHKVPNSSRPALSIYPLADHIKSTGNGTGVLDISDLGENFEEGDILEFTRNSWDFDFSADAMTSAMTSAPSNPNTPGFNPAFGVDNYFQSYGNGDSYDGTISWTFGVAVDPSQMQPDSAGKVSGQPLPGVLATLCAGCVTLAVTRKKRKALKA